MQVLRGVEGEWEACEGSTLTALMKEVAGEKDLEVRLPCPFAATFVTADSGAARLKSHTAMWSSVCLCEQKRLRTSLELSIEKVDLESALEAVDGTGNGPGQKQEAFTLTPLRMDAFITHQMTHPACGLRFLVAALPNWAWGGPRL
jgi:hypothetical protein